MVFGVVCSLLFPVFLRMRKQRAVDRDSRIHQATNDPETYRMKVEYEREQRHSAPYATDDGGGGAQGPTTRPHSSCEPFHPALRSSQSLPGPDPGATSHNLVRTPVVPSKCCLCWYTVTNFCNYHPHPKGWGRYCFYRCLSINRGIPLVLPLALSQVLSQTLLGGKGL